VEKEGINFTPKLYRAGAGTHKVQPSPRPGCTYSTVTVNEFSGRHTFRQHIHSLHSLQTPAEAISKCYAGEAKKYARKNYLWFL